MLTFLRRFTAIAVIVVAALCISPSRATAQIPGVNKLHFTETAPLPGATAAHSATALANGDILVVGGYGELFGRIPIATSLARIYDHQQHSWRVCAGRLHYGRLRHGAIRLGDGKVVIVGGMGQDKKSMASIELYDPSADKFRLVATMAQPRSKLCLNLLSEGRVLITGQTTTAEIFGPDPNSPTGYAVRPAKTKCHFRHDEHAAVNLSDGRILLVGGRTNGLEVFDPETETFRRLKARLPTVIDDQAVALLHNGHVLLAGGQQVYTSRAINQTWIYDPAADLLTPGAQLAPTSDGQSQPGAADMVAVDLFSGDPARCGRYILLAGGEFDPGRGDGQDVILDSAWVYDAVRNRFISVGPMCHPHDDFAAAALPAHNGNAAALIIAGHSRDDSFQANCEILTWRLETEQSHLKDDAGLVQGRHP